eukprot:CAMPEP_0201522358 /NCGR_PEP_ID=MMETSP0161_2-20130828/17096_1 /ASSEMBLY_ACC=CAM_ASM_000251 /TAXON_ID=180227 /ORGANISM="Neoparamoeba aestuarina, Strain SoJaBio B1-5/56/2" /LENGTH=255 /DNA_ID=CAMNT_0047921177 /DNA_START=34 /DNA_END=801 /DNA_ORIENTATION=-
MTNKLNYLMLLLLLVVVQSVSAVQKTTADEAVQAALAAPRDKVPQALQVLLNLANGPSGRDDILAAGGLEVALTFLDDARAPRGGTERAATLLGILLEDTQDTADVCMEPKMLQSCDEVVCARAAAAGVVPKLVELLPSSSGPVFHALALMVSHSQDCRTEASAALPELLKILYNKVRGIAVISGVSAAEPLAAWAAADEAGADLIASTGAALSLVRLTKSLRGDINMILVAIDALEAGSAAGAAAVRHAKGKKK